MRNTFKLQIVLLLAIILLLSGCSDEGRNLRDGDEQITEEMHNAISSYIVDTYSSVHSVTDKQFEVHKIYGSSESNGVTSIYMWSCYSSFNRSTGTEGQSGHSLPAFIQLKKDKGGYTVIKYEEPEDGSYYQSSLKKMFPKKYVKKAQNDAGNVGGLEEEMEEKVREWLKAAD